MDPRRLTFRGRWLRRNKIIHAIKYLSATTTTVRFHHCCCRCCCCPPSAAAAAGKLFTTDLVPLLVVLLGVRGETNFLDCGDMELLVALSVPPSLRKLLLGPPPAYPAKSL